MSWRTVVISKRCKLDLKLGYMVIRGEETRRVFLDEIAILIIENPAVSMTGCLLNALTEKKVKIVFCDNKHNPYTELKPLYGTYDSPKKLKTQLGWSSEIQGAVWTKIISEKIRNQALFLIDCGKTEAAAMLFGYLEELTFADETNREGLAAKVYFNAVFSMEFIRGADDAENSALDYGYAILLSAFNREIVASGYLTQLGICHQSSFNQFNLSCDLMEPFRPLVDRHVVEKDFTEFGTQEKHAMLEFMNKTVRIAGAKQTVLNAIKVYCRSVFAALNEQKPELISFYSLEGVK